MITWKFTADWLPTQPIKMDLDFQLFGVKEMEAVFFALPERMQKNVLSSAVRGGASIIKKAAKSNLQANGSVRTGLLFKSINIRVKRYSRSGIIYAAVGARRDVVGTTIDGRRIVPANYIHFVEFGTRKSRAKPFLRPAVDNNRSDVFSEITHRARKGLAREIKKLRKATR